MPSAWRLNPKTQPDPLPPAPTGFLSVCRQYGSFRSDNAACLIKHAALSSLDGKISSPDGTSSESGLSFAFDFSFARNQRVRVSQELPDGFSCRIEQR
jgi:hypothetical protein